MRKLFTSIALAAVCLSAAATDYTDQLSVIINNGTPATQQTNISVNKQSNGLYNLSLKNFKLKQGNTTIMVGDIDINDVKGVSNGQTIMLKSQQSIKIKKGSEGGLGWTGPMLGSVPVDMVGEIRDGKFYTIININMATLKQQIKVVFGEAGYQLPNADFETFHTAKLTQPADPDDPDAELETVTSDEPDHWHSFMSASGPEALAWMAGYNPAAFKSSDVRPGSTGKQSVMLKATDMYIAIANGTVTTGRMNTGSAMAADTNSNYAWSDMASTDKDAHGDAFYSTIYSRPDSMKVWLKFKQGSANADHPYATATAVLNDGTRLQEPAPENVVYTNVVGEARNAKIAETGNEWKEFTIPFAYNDFKKNNATAKSVLVTFSTNADAGQGSDGDLLYVDDMSFVYNAGLAAVSFTDAQGGVYLLNVENGKNDYVATLPFDVTADNMKVMSDGQGAYVSTTIADGKATIEITSNDLQTTNTYTVTLKKGEAQGVTSGISAAPTDTDNTVKAVFTIDGKRVNAMDKPGMYIVKTADGKAKKVLKK